MNIQNTELVQNLLEDLETLKEFKDGVIELAIEVKDDYLTTISEALESFKNKKGYAAYIKGTYPYLTHDESGWGVYGIYYTEDEEPELIYIGMTGRGFKTRWEEHYNIFQGNSKPEAGMVLYQQNLDANKISFGKLIDVKELNYEGTITTRDVEAMELALISIYQPKYNVMGRSKPYVL